MIEHHIRNRFQFLSTLDNFTVKFGDPDDHSMVSGDIVERRVDAMPRQILTNVDRFSESVTGRHYTPQ